MTDALATLLMPRAYAAATDGPLGDLRRLITVLETVLSASRDVPTYLPDLHAPGWETSAGWTPSGLLATVMLGPEHTPVPIDDLIRTWANWWQREGSTASDQVVRRGTTVRGLTTLAWASMDLEYALDTDARDAFSTLVGAALADTLFPFQREGAGNLEDEASNLHLLLDPTHPVLFDTVMGFASSDQALTWPSPQSHANHVRRVVRHAALRLAQQGLGDRETDIGTLEDHFPGQSHARWLDLVRYKLLTVAYARAHPDDQAQTIAQWATWLHRAETPATVRKATVVRLIAPWAKVPLTGNLRDDAIAAQHWPTLASQIHAVVPELAAFERFTDLQTRPAPSSRPSLGARRRV